MPEWRFDTIAIHSGTNLDPHGAIAPPIYQTATFAAPTSEELARRAEEHATDYYTRWGNPTTRYLEEKLAALEGGERALAFASGMAAVATAVLAAVRAGDHVVAPLGLYSATFELFAHVLPRYGVEATLVDASDPANYERALRPATRLVYLETPANPLMTVTDIGAVVALAHQAGATTIIDNTFASPYNQRPLDLGVDVVVHSATKYLAGHSEVTAGVVIGAAEFAERADAGLRVYGGVLDPFAAWLTILGIKTLGLRMRRHNENALRLAAFLDEHAAVSRVHYPGLPSHPGHAVAAGQMPGGYGGMLSLEVRGGVEAGRRVVESLRLGRIAVSLGAAETLVTHPASTTHIHMPREDRERAGITDGLVRVSAGLEDPDDLVADFAQALDRL